MLDEYCQSAVSDGRSKRLTSGNDFDQGSDTASSRNLVIYHVGRFQAKTRSSRLLRKFYKDDGGHHKFEDSFPSCRELVTENVHTGYRSQDFQPLASHPFTNSSSEKRCTAHVRARSRMANIPGSSFGSRKMLWSASANESESFAWKPNRRRQHSRRGGVELLARRLPVEGYDNVIERPARCVGYGNYTSCLEDGVNG